MIDRQSEFSIVYRSSIIFPRHYFQGGDSFLAVSLQNALADHLSAGPSTLVSSEQDVDPLVGSAEVLRPEFLETLLNKNFASICDVLKKPFSTKQQRLESVKYTKQLNSDKTGEFNRNKGVYRLKGRENRRRIINKNKRQSVDIITKTNTSGNKEPDNVNATDPASLPGHRVAASKVVWKVDFEKCIDSSPLLVLQEARELVVVGSHSGLVKAVDPRDGRVIWTTR